MKEQINVIEDNNGHDNSNTLSTFERTTFVERITSAPINFHKIVNDEYKCLIAKLDKENIDKPPEGDLPIYPGFIFKNHNLNFHFWINILVGLILGIIIGILATIYMNLVEKVPQVWSQLSSNDDISTYGFHQGTYYCAIITTITGFIVGSFRYYRKLPTQLSGFFKDIKEGHIDNEAPWCVLISTISLCGGAVLGPEHAMSNLGGYVAQTLGKYFTNNTNGIKYETHDKQRMLVLIGMTAALGCLFPTPMIAPLMILELTELPKAYMYMEAVLILTFASFTAFQVYFFIIGKLPMQYISHIYSYDDGNEEEITNTKLYYTTLWEYNDYQVYQAITLELFVHFLKCLSFYHLVFSNKFF